MHAPACECALRFFTPEYAAEFFGKGRPLLEVCSVPGCDHKPGGIGYCSAGNSTRVSWQKLAPPEIRKRLLYEMYVSHESCFPSVPYKDEKNYSQVSDCSPV